MDWIDVGGEEMYISNYPPENMKLKIHLFSIPPKSSAEEPYTQTLLVKWKTFGKEGRLETSLVDLKSETEVKQTQFSFEEKLFVYANLGRLPEDGSDWEQRQRVEILRVRYDGNGHFWFKPDLTGGRPAYRLNSTSALTAEEWRYKIEGVQVGPVLEVASTDVGVIPPQISWTQPAPEERFHQTYIFGEVTSAKGFEFPNVSIMVKNSCDAQTCVTHAVAPRNGSRNYSFQFEFSFLQREDAKSPELLIEAVSFGFFGNRRIEGYGYCITPHETGTHELTVPCWRPKEGVYNELRRHFLGGTGELISLNPIGCANAQSRKISRLGLTTTSTGSVTLRLRIVRHHPSRIIKESKSGISQAADENNALEMFQKARDKMLRMRQNIPKHIIK